MSDFILKELSVSDISKELEQIGFDKGYIQQGEKKFEYKNLKIYNLTPAQANILKQTALSVGADCGTHRDVISGNVDFSNVILGGSYSQLEKICNKLNYQPFQLKELASDIKKILFSSKRATKIVGILNVTPDSFSDGGEYNTPATAQKHLIKLINDGASIIDIGAESTRPNSEEVSANLQIERLKPILSFIQKENIAVPISVDTRNSEVADFALNNGCSIINDVSGFDFDNNMPRIISKYSAEVVIQHSLSTPDIMQENPTYSNVVEEIFFKLREKSNIAKDFGIKKVIIDVGIGFGKTREHNFELLNRIHEFYSLNLPIMIGLSRKSFLGIRECNNELKDIMSVALSYSLINKVDYLRVHNVKLHKTMIDKLCEDL